MVLKAGANSGAAEWQAHVKDKRGAPWSPKTIDFVEAIPVTGLGKIDRKALRAPTKAATQKDELICAARCTANSVAARA